MPRRAIRTRTRKASSASSRRRLSQRTRLREDARRSAADLLRHLGHRLLARRTSAGSARRASFRACSSRSASCWRQSDLARTRKGRRRSLPRAAGGRREEKFAALETLTLGIRGWLDCPSGWRAPFFPAASGDVGDLPAAQCLLRLSTAPASCRAATWVIAPDQGILAAAVVNG